MLTQGYDGGFQLSKRMQYVSTFQFDKETAPLGVDHQEIAGTGRAPLWD